MPEMKSLNGYEVVDAKARAAIVEIDFSPYALKEEIPTVPQNVSAFNNDAGYITEHQDISGKAEKEHKHTLSDVTDYVAPDLTPFAKTEDIPTKVSELENDSGYLTEHQDLSEYAKKGEIPTNVLTTATNTDAYRYFATLSNSTQVIQQYMPVERKEYSLDHKVKELAINENTIPVRDGQQIRVPLVPEDNNHAASRSYVDTSIANIPEIPSNVSAFTNDAGYLTEHQSLEGYAKTSDIPTVPTKVSAFNNDAGYLTEHIDISGKSDIGHTHSISEITDYTAPDLTEYALKSEIPDTSTFISAIPDEYITETELEGKGYLTEHQSLKGLATEVFVTEKIAEAQLSAGGTEIDLSNYALKSEVASERTSREAADATLLQRIEEVNSNIPTVPTNISAFTNDSGYATQSYVDNAISNNGGGSADTYKRIYRWDDIVVDFVEGGDPVTYECPAVFYEFLDAYRNHNQDAILLINEVPIKLNDYQTSGNFYTTGNGEQITWDFFVNDGVCTYQNVGAVFSSYASSQDIQTLRNELYGCGYQTADDVNALINEALGVIENGSY